MQVRLRAVRLKLNFSAAVNKAQQTWMQHVIRPSDDTIT
jgi:hypothetical protein